MGLLEDIRWLFPRGGMEHFIERKDHTYRDLTLEFLSTLHVEVTSGAQCQAGYLSFYLLGQFYEMNLSAFNEIFGFPLSLDVTLRKVPRQFNPSAFWFELARNYNYNTSSCKCTQIRNPCIQVAQCLMASAIFARDDSVDVPRLFELYLSCMLHGERLDPGSFLARQLYSATTSTKDRIVVGEIITSIARFLGIEPNPDDRVSGSKRVDKAAFELMDFCKVEVGRLCWIYPGGRLMPLPILNEPPFVIITIFHICLVMMKCWLLLPHMSLFPLPLDLVPLPNHHLLPPLTLNPHLGPFKKSKRPFGLMLLLSMPLFKSLSKSGMMSFEG